MIETIFGTVLFVSLAAESAAHHAAVALIRAPRPVVSVVGAPPRHRDPLYAACESMGDHHGVSCPSQG